eukprot:CAMPEP_0175829118 /NCGR_PEP_ID=MMETSP0107_2-20121207/13167_1 /TAXON_ID=195067 ORGANISM="Goniomonas pacifica, Strain CCMP1869" /NCGR_SAMPLE_ID=MMETSP0107_2 /ASSEMBLY_ACC=CAM_ASM_000203 /LENGTH=69 /DNA_ID=CAMNT_0017141881 /DNA_START=354 /DNA_END=564 /DNA_ORIENTATION=+
MTPTFDTSTLPLHLTHIYRVLTDVLVLSQCHYLVYAGSNIPTAVWYIAPNVIMRPILQHPSCWSTPEAR